MKNTQFLFNVATGIHTEYKGDIESIIDDAIKNRLVYPILLWNNNLKILKENWIIKKRKAQKKLKELDILIQEFKKESIEFINLKGLAMLKYYPKELTRQCNDFDFLIKDIDDFWKCHKILFSLGYLFVYNPMLTKSSNGKIIGITKYIKKIDQDTSIAIEININSFIITEATWFNDSDLWETLQIIKYQGIELRIPSDNMNLIILVIEASGRNHFFIRDAVDFYFLNKFGNIDFSYINNILEDKFLIEVLNNFIKNNSTVRTGSFNFITHKIKRLNRSIKHILPNILKDKNVFKFYLLILQLLGEQLLRKEKLISLVKHMDKIMSPKSRFENGIITHFYLLSPNLTGNLKWINYKRYQIVIMPIGTFLATNFAILEEWEETEIKIFVEYFLHNSK